GCLRLPTEAEWEYAVRANTHPNILYFFGSNPFLLNNYAIYGRNSGEKTHKVKRKNHNPWSLYDMYGNVWEFVQDTWSEKLPGGTDPIVNVVFSDQVLRGGSYYNSSDDLRSAFRIFTPPKGKGRYIGFRLVRTL
ncbi:MAG: formylglycine-generating enzyme family protein, partial [Bdellovibrionaceae bacterium]|nr:formylglycine-generating enzyme family protein [Pseudobdellovibrionaceae bacterium]